MLRALLLGLSLAISSCSGGGDAGKPKADPCKDVPNPDNTPVNCGKCADYSPECGWCFESATEPDPFKGTCVDEANKDRVCTSKLWVRSGDRCDNPKETQE